MRWAKLVLTVVASLTVMQAQAGGVTTNDPYSAYATATASALAKSASPRDWALASQLLGFRDNPLMQPDASAALLRKAAQAAPTDPLVQWMWADAYRAGETCGTPAQCQDRSMALVRLEPDNAAGWLAVFDHAADPKDAALEEQALARMAALTHFDEHIDLAAKAWLDVYKRYPPPSPASLSKKDPQAILLGSPTSLALREAGYSTVSVGPQMVFQSCRRSTNSGLPAAHFAACGQIGRLLMEKGQILTQRVQGFLILRIAGEVKPVDLPAIRELMWQRADFYRKRGLLDAATGKAMLASWALHNNDQAAIDWHLRRSGLPLHPPATWQPTFDGQPLDMLHAQ